MTKILIVEDEKILQKMYGDKFSSTGYEIIFASDGEEGLEKARAEKPDFILLDLMMPKISGIEVLKELKTNGDTRHIPVAIFSVIPEEDSLLDGSRDLLKEVVGYFRKDETNPSEIVEKVKELIDK